MLKRLIEVALPLKEVSEHSAREKSIRQGNISTLHIWWARRPLATCRAVIFASLIPDADDPECPESFRSLVNELLNENEFRPKNSAGSTTEDTPRNRSLEFIKHLVQWGNSTKQHYIERARKLIAAAHKILHPNAQGDAPKVLDPFAGGAAFPLEALRLGCDTHAIDLNPVAHLIELCTLVYPQKYGQPNSLPVPNYIRRLIAHNKAVRRAKGQESADLFTEAEDFGRSDEFMPDVEITEAEYLKNPLVADVKYWGHYVLAFTRKELRPYFSPDQDGSSVVAFIWARTVECPNPTCRLTIPLVKQLWLCNKPKKKVAMRLVLDHNHKTCRIEIANDKEIEFDPDSGTAQEGQAACPLCHAVITGSELRSKSTSGQIGQQLLVVVTSRSESTGKRYRLATESDKLAFQEAELALKQLQESPPNEPIPPDRPSPNSRGLSGIVNYGITTFGSMFNSRQALTHLTFVRFVQKAAAIVRQVSGAGYADAIGAYLSLCVDQVLPFSTNLNRWKPDAEAIVDLWGRQAVPMVWDYCENNPIGDHGGTWLYRLGRFMQPVQGICLVPEAATVVRGSATRLPSPDSFFAAVVTDPPYYDSVPYGDLSDFFYVWLKRSLKEAHPDLFRTPLTPKREELIAYYGSGKRQIQKPPDWYEQGMSDAFKEIYRVVADSGIACVMFAHKTTSAWESIVGSLLKAGLSVTASWPFHTELTTRMVARDAAALASSVTLVCRKRKLAAGDGLWGDVRKELKKAAKERLDFFWSQGIRGADFFISAIGPALSVFGKYERVTKLSGDEVSVGVFLDEVRSLVTAYALNKIMKTTQIATIDPDTQFYVIWKWSYGEAKVPADEAFKLAQALGMDTETMWDRTGILEKAGENVLAVPIAKRMKIKNLGEPNADTTPASIIDVLHRLCVFRDKNDTEGMIEFLARSGQGRNSNLWLVAQAVSEILPDGDKEKQLMQGLLNQRDNLEEAARDKKLF